MLAKRRPRSSATTPASGTGLAISLPVTLSALPTTSLIVVQLPGADLRRPHLRGTWLRRADRQLARLGEAALSDADRLGAALRAADLSGADLGETALGMADLTDC